MLRPLHSEFPLLWVIFFPPWAAFFSPERSFSQTISAESIQDITGTDAVLLGHLFHTGLGEENSTKKRLPSEDNVRSIN